MAPTYKLQYFNVKALGEPIRLLLSYGGAEFEDERFEGEQWPKIKPTMPFGKAPVLEVDGKQTHQSSAICRYLAKQYGLAGANDWESMQIDSVVDTFTDFRIELAKFFYEQDPAVKETKKGPILANVVPYYLSKFEQLVKDNGGFFHGGKLSWADLYWVGISDYLSHILGGRVSDGHPSLRELEDQVLALPPIAAWVARRPATDM